MSPSTPPRGKASAAAGARLMEDVERALARVDPSASHAGASPSERRVATALRGARGLARADLERRLVSRAACDALAELQRRLDAAKAETRDAVEACRAARAERETTARDRERERREWLANRDAVRKEIAAARDRVAAVKDEHRLNLAELDRERRRTRVAVEETSAVKDELARVSDANVSLERRLARARAEVAAARAELAARGDAVDEAMARNARNAAVAAREVLRRADRNDDDDRLREVSFLHPSSRENGDDFLLTKYSVSRRQTPFAPRDANDDRARSSAPPSPSPTTISHTSRTRAASRGPNDGSFSFPKDKPGENEDDARRQKTDSVDASDATMTTKEEESVVGSRALAAAEARAARLARLNAVLLDRLGDVIGAAPRAERRDEETETETETVVSTTRRASDDASLRALESEVKAMDAEYRETMATIASMTSVSNARYGGLASDIAAARAIDAAAARANALEDAIVRKVEEVQRLRDEASASSEK